jgi:valyl-tRNA synthetase
MSLKLKADVKKNDLGRYANGLKPGASLVVRKTTLDIVAECQERSRVDTGAMKNGWQADFEDELHGAAVNNVAHVVPNEYGTVNMAAQPMATPAAEHARPGFVEAMKQVARGE